MKKLKKRVIKITIIIAVFIVLLMLYAHAPIFGVPICSFDKYIYDYIGGSTERLYMSYHEKTNDIIVSPENEEEENIYLLRGEIYEDNILKEKFTLNKKVKEFKKKHESHPQKWDYQIHKLPKIKVDSEFKIIIYYKDKNGEHSLIKIYRLEKNPFYPCRIILPIPH